MTKKSAVVGCQQLTVIGLASSAIVSRVMPARTVSSDFTHAPGTTLEQMLGLEMAGALRADYLADDVSIDVDLEIISNLSKNAMGNALPGIRADRSDATWRNKREADATTSDDRFAIAHSQDDEDKFTAFIDGYKVDNNESLKITRAEAKVIGMLDGRNNALDRYILMRVPIEFDAS